MKGNAIFESSSRVSKGVEDYLMIQQNDVPDSGGSIFDHLRVADVMEKDVQFGHEQTKGDVLASLMIEGFGGVPIVDGNQRLVGIVT